MALQDTIVNLGNAIINLVNSKILKANNEQNEEIETTLLDLKAKIDELVEQGGGAGGTEISLMDFVNNTEVETLNTTNKTIVGSINEVDSTIGDIDTTLDTIIKRGINSGRYNKNNRREVIYCKNFFIKYKNINSKQRANS